MLKVINYHCNQVFENVQQSLSKNIHTKSSFSFNGFERKILKLEKWYVDGNEFFIHKKTKFIFNHEGIVMGKNKNGKIINLSKNDIVMCNDLMLVNKTY